MNVLQSDKKNFRAELVSVRVGLNPFAQNLRRAEPPLRQKIIQIHAREKMHDRARRQVREQVRLVAVLVGPVHDVRDLELDRDAYGDQTDRRRLERVVRVGVVRLNRRRRAVADEKILLLIVRDRPKNYVLFVLARVRREADVKRLDLLRAIAIDFVNWPRQFQMRARSQRRINWFSEMLQNRLLARVHENDAR